jgi:hydroxymethylbilane synthase
MVAKRRSQPARKTSPKSAATARRPVKKAAKRPVTKAAPKPAASKKGKPASVKAPAKAKKQPVAPKAKPAAVSKEPAPSKPAPVAAAPAAPRNLRSQISDLKSTQPAPVAKPAAPAVVAPAAKPAAVAPAPAPVAKPAPVSKSPAPPAAAPLPTAAANLKSQISEPTSPAPAPAAKPAAAPAPAAAAVAPAPAPAPKPAAPPPPVRRPLVTLTLVTRKSPLAVAQSELVLARFAERIPSYAFRVFKLVTTGDRQAEWSLEQQGGKGLFTGELEQALTDHRADVAVHSAKDLPTEMPEGLALAGFLPREDPRDVLVVREDVQRPLTIATGSPRRRLQLERQFQKATFCEIRGNVDTRLRKIAEDRVADATVLAAAGLKRLGITEFPGLRFQPLPLAVSVPAVGQAAVAVQARVETANFLRPHLDEPTRVAVELERAFLRLMGGGCHTAFAVHYDGTGVHLFHENCGYQRFTIALTEALEPVRVAERILAQLKLRA